MPLPAHNPTDWTLDCADLAVVRGGRTVLDGIELAIGPGDCVSLVGPNGSGKTTLLLALLGMLRPARGKVRLDGRDLRRIPPRRRAAFAAYVPQNVDALPPFTVREVVAGGRYPHASAFARLTEQDQAAIEAALARCGLSELAGRRIDAVSGGERQKAFIGAAIAQNPQLLVLDEPNAGLDPGYQLELVRLLRDWHEGGRATLVVSHDLQLPAALGGRVIALQAGRVAAQGPAGDVLTAETLGAVYRAPFGAVTTESGRRLVLPAWWFGD